MVMPLDTKIRGRGINTTHEGAAATASPPSPPEATLDSR